MIKLSSEDLSWVDVEMPVGEDLPAQTTLSKISQMAQSAGMSVGRGFSSYYASLRERASGAVANLSAAFKPVLSGQLKEAKTEEEYSALLNAYLARPVQIVTRLSQEAFLARANGTQNLEEHEKQIIKDLDRNLPVFLEGKALEEIVLQNGGFLSKEKAKIFSLLHQGPFVGNYAETAPIFINIDLDIHLFQVDDEGLQQIGEKLHATVEERANFIANSFNLKISFDKDQSIVLDSKQVVKVRSAKMDSTLLVYLLVHTHYEKEEQIRTLQMIKGL